MEGGKCHLAFGSKTLEKISFYPVKDLNRVFAKYLNCLNILIVSLLFVMLGEEELSSLWAWISVMPHIPQICVLWLMVINKSYFCGWGTCMVFLPLLSTYKFIYYTSSTWALHRKYLWTLTPPSVYLCSWSSNVVLLHCFSFLSRVQLDQEQKNN